ncbi:MAG: hypothetical protein LBV67_02545 [Streptococcaceae bacterium]|jgi:hypothetical protein|nr:hypothetical protein [Streptococcaceae bacterium]
MKNNQKNTSFNDGIDATENKSSYDAACKRLLSEKIVLAWILKTCTKEFKDFDIRLIMSCIDNDIQVALRPLHRDGIMPIVQGIGTEDSTINEGKITYDIRFKVTVPSTGEKIEMIINIEAQNVFNPGYPLIKRGIFYTGRMLSAQYGTEFKKYEYDKVKKVYSIWVVMNPPKERFNTISKYEIKEEMMVGSAPLPSHDYDLLTVVMICLGDTKGSEENPILKLLGTLLANKLSKDEKKKVLTEEYDIEMTETMEDEVETMCNLSQGLVMEGRLEGKLEGKEDKTNEIIKRC